MKSSFFVMIVTVIFIFLGVFNHNKINDFSHKYINEFNTIEINIKDDNWKKASNLLSKTDKKLQKEKNTWYKLINHGYFNEIFESIQILKQSLDLEDKMISLQEIEKIKMVLENLMEDECYNCNRIF